MVYDWDGKEDQCYKLYVEDRRSLDEVMQIMKDSHAGFAPSKRAFQTQFKRWDFPSKQNPAHKNEALVQRTKELWEKNTSQKDMLRTLNEEGYDIKERELMRVRAKNRWLLRVPNGTKSYGGRTTNASIESSDGMDPTFHAIEQAILDETNREEDDEEEKQSASPRGNATPSAERELSPEVQKKRQMRLQKLQAESAERWATKKRRRRTRGYSGLPADPPGPPRFPSETTIDESKAYLKLDNALYREIRDQFTSICEEAGFVKKTVAGPEKWQAAKDRLIAENAHLQHVFYNDSTALENKQLSLDVVCTDVTKRMRTLERRMTIAEAKNVLGINPEESRVVRNAFYEELKADHFTSKLEAGEEHWKELKARWVQGSEILQRILAPGMADPQHEQKVKAMEVMCRDVMKRLRDDQTKRDPLRKKQVNSGPGPGPAPPRITTKPPSVKYPEAEATPAMAPIAVPTASMARKPTQRTRTARPTRKAAAAVAHTTELQIDPSLLAAAADPAMALEQLQHYASAGSNLHPSAYASGMQHSSLRHNPNDPSLHQHHPHHQHQSMTNVLGSYHTHNNSHAGTNHGSGHSIPVFFRLSPHSPYQVPPTVWLGSISTTNGGMADLRAIASRDHPWGAAAVLRIDGIVGTQEDSDLGMNMKFTHGGDAMAGSHGGLGHGMDDGENGGLVGHGGNHEGEMAYLLERDEELAGYLDFILSGPGKATFSVQLAAVVGG